MGGSSGGQVTGYRYFTNLLLFIGNPIENLLAINFDKRGWIVGDRVNQGDKGELIGIKAQDLYGENEGGVYGVINLHTGTNTQLPDAKYSQYMSSKGLQASAYPYQSYLSFSGSGKVDTSNSWIDGVFGLLAGYMNNAFYVGNSGYMKEMLLWPKRIHVRNDGRGQWYEVRGDGAVVCEIGAYKNPSECIYIDELMPINPEISIKSSLYNQDFSGFFVWSRIFGVNIGVSASAKFSMVYSSSVDILFDIYQVKSSSHDISITSNHDFTVENIETGDGSWSKKISARLKAGINKRFEIYFNIEFSANTGIENYFFFGSRRPQIVGGNYCGPESEGKDINPIHKIREILTDDTAMNKPESSVNDVNFMKAADRIYDEGLGISWSITEKSCMDAISELCYHIEAGIRVNRQTGLYEMVLFRDDWFDESEIHTIAESKIKKNSMQYEITNADEVINQLNVNFYDRDNIKNSSFSISESGLIQTLGRVNAETVDFPYFMNMRNAEIVANWKLKILSTGVLKGSFSTGWREARKWNRYDLIRLPWSKRWVGTILVRIMSIKLGGPTSNEVSIEWVEVVPSTGMMNTTIVVDDPVNTQPEAPKPCNAKVFELPYFEAVQAFGEREVGIELADNPNIGYLCAIAEKPQNNSLNAALHVDSGNGFERVATVNYCETAYLDQAIDRMSSAFVVKNAGNIASVRIGSQIFINDETMVYQSYDAETKVLTVKRGALNTAPQSHAIDSILYFADDFIAVDQTLYVQSEIVDAKVLTTTPSGILALSDAANYGVEFNARAIRPYPPANVKINDGYWTAEIETDLIITWVDRNRAQQTGGEILGWYEGGVTLENRATYQLILTERDENEVELRMQNLSLGSLNTYTFATAAMNTNTRTIEITLKSLRDGYESYQSFNHTVELSQFFSAPHDLTVEFKND